MDNSMVTFLMVFWVQIICAQNTSWNQYVNDRLVQKKYYTRGVVLTKLVTYDDGEIADSIVFHNSHIVHRQDSSTFPDIESKYFSRGSFASKYLRFISPIEEYIYDFENIYTLSTPPHKVFYSKGNVIISNKLNMRVNHWFYPVILQSYMNDEIIKSWKIKIKNNRVSSIVYMLRKCCIIINFEYYPSMVNVALYCKKGRKKILIENQSFIKYKM